MTDTEKAIAEVWRNVGVPNYRLPSKAWFDKLDAAIRADERAKLKDAK